MKKHTHTDWVGLQVWLRCQHIQPAVQLCDAAQVSDITSDTGGPAVDLKGLYHHIYFILYLNIVRFECTKQKHHQPLGTSSYVLFFWFPVHRVLMLHLKRVCFTSLVQLEKLCVPVDLFRELLVTSSQVRNNSPEFKYKVNMWSVCTGVFCVCVCVCVCV